MKQGPHNLTIVESRNFTDIANHLKEHAKAAHFTNGTYAMKPEIMVPTTLAGFKAIDVYPNLPLVIAINSDTSMKALNKEGFEDEMTRANNVAVPLAQTFKDNQVLVVFYDETTPNALYKALAKENLTRTLHKWGYGTTDDAPKIEGAELFEHVYGYPLPNDTKPICWHDTDKADEKQNIQVKDLRGQFISNDGVLFTLPGELAQFQAQDNKNVLKTS